MPAAAIISLIGSAFFILAFGALNFGLVTVDNYAYQIANTAGAACFTYTAIQPFNPGAVHHRVPVVRVRPVRHLQDRHDLAQEALNHAVMISARCSWDAQWR